MKRRSFSALSSRMCSEVTFVSVIAQAGMLTNNSSNSLCESASTTTSRGRYYNFSDSLSKHLGE
jgi:hypothetical protein